MRISPDAPSRARSLATVVLILALLQGSVYLAGCATERAKPAWLQVSENGHYLVNSDGRPFIMQADSAWWWSERSARGDVDRYLDKRHEQGFNVIMIAAKFDPGNYPNTDGQKIWDGDASKLNPAYFDHIDYIVEQAEARGMQVALAPAWVKHVTPEWGNALTMDNAYGYGQWIGQRYRDHRIIWVMGGDDVKWHEGIVRKVARGVTNGVTGSDNDHDGVTMTYHPGGGSSSMTKFHDDAWLDFNMAQSGDCDALAAGHEFTIPGFNQMPAKPIIDGEPIFEDAPICSDASGPYSTPTMVRNALYNGVFGGGAGIAYGHHSVWQMYQPGRVGVNGPTSYWYDALDDEAANQVQYLRKLLESRPVFDRIPDGSTGTALAGTRYTKADDGAYVMGYSSDGRALQVELSDLSGNEAQLWWYDPRTGVAIDNGRVPTTGRIEKEPPSRQDWVLVADDAARGFPAPGVVDEVGR